MCHHQLAKKHISCWLSWGVLFSSTSNLGEYYSQASSTMPRERGKPHHGSAWHTHAAHRQRRQHMERALSLANSILQQRVRVAHFALHAPIIESATKKRAQTPPALDNWQPTGIKREENPPPAPKTQAGSSLRGKIEEDFPTFYIEEIPCPEEAPTALEPQARDKGQAL